MAEQQQNTEHSSLFSDSVKLYQPDSSPGAFDALDYPALLGSWAVSVAPPFLPLSSHPP